MLTTHNVSRKITAAEMEAPSPPPSPIISGNGAQTQPRPTIPQKINQIDSWALPFELIKHIGEYETALIGLSDHFTGAILKTSSFLDRRTCRFLDHACR